MHRPSNTRLPLMRHKPLAIAIVIIGAALAGLLKRDRLAAKYEQPEALPRAEAPTPPPQVSQPPARSNAQEQPARTEAKPRSEPASSSGVLRIASWNIEWLGKPEDRSGAAKGIAQRPEDMADYIRASDASIVAVEEIVTRQRGEPIRSPELEAAIAKLNSSGQSWEYVLFPGRAEGDQLTGVLWNRKAVTALNASGKPWDQTRDRPWALPIPKARSAQGSALWNRPPHAMKFSTGEGKTDIVVIVLHMKADYNGDFAAHRKEEAAALVRALPEVRKAFQDDDVVIIGDTNCPQGPEPATRDIEAAGFVDLNARGLRTHWQGGTMDRAFVPTGQPEFAGRAFEVVSDGYLKPRGLSPRDFKQRFSDHYMIVTSLAIQADDD